MGGKKSEIRNESPRIGALRIQSSCYGKPIPIVWGTNRIAGNLIWYGDFQAIAHTTEQSSGGKGGGGMTQIDTTYTYSSSFAIAMCEGPIDGFGTIWSGKNLTGASGLGMAVFTGTYPQTPWGYLTSFHAGEDLNYAGVSYGAIANFDLGNNADVPNFSVEIQGRLRYGSGIVDANPKDIVNDAITNLNYGLLFPSGKVGDLTQFSNYCIANDIFLSPALEEQESAHDFMDHVCESANSAPFWSEGKIKIVPYGDETKTAHSVTFTPVTTPIYDLTDDDFLYEKGEDPVKVSRVPAADAYNHIQVEFLNRDNQYNTEIAEAKDQANIEQYGLRTGQPKTMHEVCSASVARTLAQLGLQRTLYIRNKYEFKLSWRYCLLEPMDPVTLTDSSLGLNRQLVRITSIEEDEQGAFTISAEDFPIGVASAALYSTQVTSGYTTNYNVIPGNVNAPIIFEPPSRITETGVEVWCCVSNIDTNYGGCEVWASTDNATYKRAGTLYGQSRMGVTENSFPVNADPDTTNILKVDLTTSRGELLAGTQQDVDLFRTLCYVGGELISYRDATLTAANKYDLGYTRRGAYGTEIVLHAIGTRFSRLDNAVLKIPYTKDQISNTLYLKLLAFNQYRSVTQNLADVTTYSYLIVGPTAPENVTSFSAQQVGNVVTFSWDRLSDPAIVGYDISFGPPGTTNWNDLTPLTQSSMGTEMTNAAVPPGDWLFAIRARNIADRLSPVMATFAMEVVSNADVIVQPQQAPEWKGTLTNFVKHWTGVLLPDDQHVANYYTSFEWCDQFVPTPYDLCSYEAPEIDIGFDDDPRAWAIIEAVLGPGVTSGIAAPDLYLDYKLSAGSYDGFELWTIGVVNARYFKFKLVLDTSFGKAKVTGFRPTVDQEEFTQSIQNVAVSVGGSTISFPYQFHNIPNVVAVAVSGSQRSVSVTNVTRTGFDAKVFNGTTDVGGTINYDATGV